ncbi:VWA domain-containing protein [Roseiconus sp. JC912]
MAFALTPASADEPVSIRLQQKLVGRHDNLRVNTINSLPADYQSRLDALPTVIASLELLRNDRRFRGPAGKNEPELPEGVLLMIQFVGQMDRPESTQALCELLDMPRPTWIMAAAQSLGHHQHHNSIEQLEKLIDSDHFPDSYGFRFVLARALTEMNHPDAWEALARLSAHVDGQLAYLLEKEFNEVTAAGFLGDKERFDKWRDSLGLNSASSLPDDEEMKLESGINVLADAIKKLNGNPKTSNQVASTLELPQKMNLSPGQSAVSYLRQKRLSPSHYYGIEIYAKRLLFVLDRSGSMNSVVYGQSRMDKAKRELIAAIEGLDPECEFGIIVFDTAIRPWRSMLVEANEQNKRESINFVSKLSGGNRTNTYAALRNALEFDSQLEAVFMLTDGQPTTGALVNPSAILLDILRRNAVHNITINTVAISVEPPMESFLRQLAEPSRGECRVVD